MTLVIHTHVTEADVTAAIRNHHLNLATILQMIRDGADAFTSAQAQILALGLRDPAAARGMAHLLAVMSDAARDAAADGFAHQRGGILP